MSSVGKVKCNFGELKDFQTKLNKFAENELEEFIQSCAKELAARLLAKVIKRTPVGKYPKTSGKKGGTLRRGWTGGKLQAAQGYVQTLNISYNNGVYTIEIKNPVEYAPYVEFGHRTRNHSGWVKGQYMLTISEQELQAVAPAIIERKLNRKLGELFK